MTNTMLERLGQELIAFVLDEERAALKIKDFLQHKGIHIQTWQNWYTKHETLRRYHDHAKMILGNRREHGMLHKKLDSASAAFMQPMYDDDWADMQKRKADLNAQKDGDGKGQFVVHMIQAETTAIVPVKDKNEGSV
jgi:hypothetical protein